jgi:hypothetical protein
MPKSSELIGLIEPNKWELITSDRECPEDAALYFFALKNAIKVGLIRVVDLGIGHGVACLGLLKNPLIERLIGVEKNLCAFNGCKSNAIKLGVDQQKLNLICGDFNDRCIQEKIANYKPDIIASNPPYLPCTNTNYPDSVRGGPDGCKYVPSLVLKLGYKTNARVLITNFTSVANSKKILGIIKKDPNYEITNCIILKCPFGFYTSQMIKQLQNYSPSVFYVDKNGLYWQLIISVVLTHTKYILKASSDLIDLISISIAKFKKTGNVVITDDRIIKLHLTSVEMERLRGDFSMIGNN